MQDTWQIDSSETVSKSELSCSCGVDDLQRVLLRDGTQKGFWLHP